MKETDSLDTLVVRVNSWKLFQGILISTSFVFFGILMVIMPLTTSKANIPGYRGFVILVAIAGILFGGAGILTMGYSCIKRRALRWPMLTLRSDGMFDHRYNVFIPYQDIRAMHIDVYKSKILPLYQIYLDMVDPPKYANIEKWSKQQGWQRPDEIIIHLTLASAKDFRLARDYIRRHIKGVEDDGIRTLD
ncbi:MAG: hypothetical protein ABTQ25_06320 [Nitrosomonas ureae]